MSLTTLINRPVVLERRSDSDVLDEAGDAIDDIVSIETVAELQPRTTTEPTGHPDIAESDWVGYFLPADAEYLDSGSSIWAPGLGTYKVVGMPPVWRNPRTQQDRFVEVDLKQTAGAEDDLGS